MSQIVKKFIGDNEVGAAKVRLENDSYLRARNVGNSADVNLLKLNSSDQAVLSLWILPSADGTSGQVLQTNGSGVLSFVTPTPAPTWEKETFTLSAGDITNGYIDLANVAKTDSIDFVVSGLISREGADYTVSYTGGAGGNTRITFSAHTPTLAASDVVVVKYQY